MSESGGIEARSQGCIEFAFFLSNKDFFLFLGISRVFSDQWFRKKRAREGGGWESRRENRAGKKMIIGKTRSANKRKIKFSNDMAQMVG